MQKSKKTVNIEVKLLHMNKKPLERKRIFVQTPLTLSTFKIIVKKNSRRKTTRIYAPPHVSA